MLFNIGALYQNEQSYLQMISRSFVIQMLRHGKVYMNPTNILV